MDNAGKRIALLADRIEGLISQEHAKWISAQEQALASDRPPARAATAGDERKEVNRS